MDAFPYLPYHLQLTLINLSFKISATGAVEVVVVVEDADHVGVAAAVAAVGVEPFSMWGLKLYVGG